MTDEKRSEDEALDTENAETFTEEVEQDAVDNPTKVGGIPDETVDEAYPDGPSEDEEWIVGETEGEDEAELDEANNEEDFIGEEVLESLAQPLENTDDAEIKAEETVTEEPIVDEDIAARVKDVMASLITKAPEPRLEKEEEIDLDSNKDAVSSIPANSAKRHIQSASNSKRRNGQVVAGPGGPTRGRALPATRPMRSKVDSKRTGVFAINDDKPINDNNPTVKGV